VRTFAVLLPVHRAARASARQLAALVAELAETWISTCCAASLTTCCSTWRRCGSSCADSASRGRRGGSSRGPPDPSQPVRECLARRQREHPCRRNVEHARRRLALRFDLLLDCLAFTRRRMDGLGLSTGTHRSPVGRHDPRREASRKWHRLRDPPPAEIGAAPRAQAVPPPRPSPPETETTDASCRSFSRAVSCASASSARRAATCDPARGERLTTRSRCWGAASCSSRSSSRRCAVKVRDAARQPEVVGTRDGEALHEMPAPERVSDGGPARAPSRGG